MTKKLLVYNMPKNIVDSLNKFSVKYSFKMLEAKEKDLGRKVEDILDEKIEYLETIKTDLEHIDINFLMIHNFSDDELNQLLKDMRDAKLLIPNKCISTVTNKNWILHDLLKENKEESELMPILHGLYSVRKAAAELIEAGNKDKNLEIVVDDITAYIEKQNFDKETMRNLYNTCAAVVNEHYK